MHSRLIEIYQTSFSFAEDTATMGSVAGGVSVDAMK